MFYQPNPIKRESIVPKTADEISRYIHRENLKPGDRLPPEALLSRTFGVSRNSLREALRILQALGLIHKRPGEGAIVAPSSPILAQETSYDEAALVEAAPTVLQVRMLVERNCAELAAKVGTADEFADLAGHLSRIQDALKREDFVSAAEAHRAFHDTLVAAARNPILSSIYRQVRFIQSEIVRRGEEIYRDRRHLELHRAIYGAVSSRDQARAATEVTKHFQAVEPFFDFIIRRSTPDPRGSDGLRSPGKS